MRELLRNLRGYRSYANRHRDPQLWQRRSRPTDRRCGWGLNDLRSDALRHSWCYKRLLGLPLSITSARALLALLYQLPIQNSVVKTSAGLINFWGQPLEIARQCRLFCRQASVYRSIPPFPGPHASCPSKSVVSVSFPVLSKRPQNHLASGLVFFTRASHRLS